MQLENPLTFVRSLKGAPASVLWAFFFTRHAMTALELSQWTGYKGDNLTVALRLLVDLGWLTARSSRGPWCLVEGRQLPLMNVLESETLKLDESDLIGFKSSSSSSSKSKLIFPTIEQEEEEEVDESDLIGFVKENLKAMDEVGIREPARSRLSKLEHVNPEMIRAHADLAKADGYGIGTAIHRIEFNWSLPEHVTKDMVRTSTGRNKGVRVIIPHDIVKEVADFTGHREECPCIDCTVGRMEGISRLCPDCKRYNCVCEESEEA